MSKVQLVALVGLMAALAPIAEASPPPRVSVGINFGVPGPSALFQ